MTYLLHHLLRDSAARVPDAEAVSFGKDALSYRELEGRSNQLAHALIASGVQPGDRVGLYLGKSIEAIIGIFGILKSGACYVPVDAGMPGARLADIANQCALRSLITSKGQARKLSAAFPESAPMTSVFFADALPSTPLPFGTRTAAFQEALAAQPDTPPEIAATDHDLAYILFTSGSTGHPKGVMLSHRNALTFVDWACETFSVTSGDRLSNHAPFNFDLSILDVFVAAKAGAALCPVPDGLSAFPIRLSAFLETQRISLWYSVPLALSRMLSHGKLEEKELPHLRWILFAGEVFPVKQLRKLMQTLPHARYANLYGPTETNVCTWHEVATVPAEGDDPVPIGKACANTRVLAIDANGRLVTEPGREGVLYASGSIVMQGYFDRPEETAKSFIPNPFAPWRDERLYCTGDWVTLDTNGDYRFIGRRDHMVKTRGYRVELGEIEAALHTHPMVREAVVIPVPDEEQGNRLVALVAPEPGDEELTAIALKQQCAARLPAYMVPETVELRVELPRTLNGKIDRQKLALELSCPSG